MTSIAFLFGLVPILYAFERTATSRIERTGGQSLKFRDVYAFPQLASTPSQTVERVYLGDSVARQFFPSSSEPHANVRFLTTNGALGMPGNYYLLERAFRACPNARDAVLMVRPETLQVNLDPPYVGDYFCALFHTPREVEEVFAAKRDLRLTSIHVGRWLLSGTMAINGAWHQDPEALTRPFIVNRGISNVPPPPANNETLLLWLSVLFGGPRSWTPIFSAPDRVTDVVLSPLGEIYLQRMRALCESRGGRLKLVASPYPSDLQWRDVDRILDAPIFYVPPDQFSDGVHIGPPHVWLQPQVGNPIARRLAEAYGLLGDLPTHYDPPK